MGKSEYYTQEQAIRKLALDKDDLLNLVREGKLREFRIEGDPKYKTSEIDAMAAEINPTIGSGMGDDSMADTGSESAIELSAIDASDAGSDVISLEESGDQPAPVDKDDTVVTQAGVSVFDEDELAGLDADPMAKTQIAPSMSDDFAIESGGGSGLLDMTRESDDTSLGAELLDEIYSGDEAQQDKPAPEATGQAQAFEQEEEAVVPMQRMMVQVVDPAAGIFTGLLAAAGILLGFTGFVAAGLVAGVLPGFVGWLSSMIYIWLVIAVIVTAAGVGVGYVMGKRPAI